MNGYKINDNLYINCDNIDYVSFLNDKVKIHMNDNTSYYITQDQYADIETKIPQGGGSGGGSSGGGANITSNIKIVANKNSVLSSNHNKLCIVNDANDLNYEISYKPLPPSQSRDELSILSSYSMKYISNYVYVTYGGGCGSIYTDLENNAIYLLAYLYTFPGNIAYTCMYVYKYDIDNDTWSTEYNTDSFGGYNAQRVPSNECIVGNKLYYIRKTGSSGDGWRLSYFDTITKTFTTVGSVEQYGTRCSVLVDGDIYQVYIGSTIAISKIKIDTGEKTNLLSGSEIFNEDGSIYSPTSYGTNSVICYYGNKLYAFGSCSNDENMTYYNDIYVIDLSSKKCVKLNITLPNTAYICGCIVNNKFYFFNGTTTIYSFDFATNTIEETDIILPTDKVVKMTFIKDYIFFITSTSTHYKLSIKQYLETGKVYILTLNVGYNFNIIDGLSIPVSNVYIGDNDGIAKKVDAYLYDETKSAWVNVNTGEVLTV